RQQLKLQPLPSKVQVPVRVRMLEQYGKDITLCPKCKTGKLVLMHISYGTQGERMPLRTASLAQAIRKENPQAPP
ncbi:MAG: hypothetical protein ACR2KB_18575, partial [Chitinophagaceae bacterium]